MNKNHMSALQMKHAALENKLEHEENRPFPDTNKVHFLKKQKLMLKDAIAQETAIA